MKKLVPKQARELFKNEKRRKNKEKILQLSELLENSKLEIQMLQDVNRSLKEFLIYGLKSEDNLASLNSHFDGITQILIQSAESEKTRNGEPPREKPENESKEEILARILNLEIEIDKIHKLNEQSVNQSNINEVIDQMSDLNSQLQDTVAQKDAVIENFGTCQICFENYDYRERHRSILSLCGHVLCFSCATTISEHKDGKTCPTCRKSFMPEHIIKIFEATIL